MTITLLAVRIVITVSSNGHLALLAPEMTTVSVWSCGPSSQYKNLYAAAFTQSVEEMHQKTIHWNLFAISNAKRPVDRMGGAVKRPVWKPENAATFV